VAGSSYRSAWSPVGLESLHDGGFSRVGEETHRKIRAQRLDEGLLERLDEGLLD
jgi:hypothetical protein